MLKSLKILAIFIMLLFIFSNICFATEINMNLLNHTENSVNENETNLVENTDSTDNIPSDDTIGGTAAPSDVSSIEQEDMSFSNILNILVITVGVVIILLAIAILIRLKS